MAKWELYSEQWLRRQFALQGDEFTTGDNKWQLRELVSTLVNKEIIPENIKDDATLYALLVAQMHKMFGEMLKIPAYGFVLPTYQYVSQTTHALTILNAERVEQQKKHLERETGINISHYYKIKTVMDKRSKAPFIITTTRSGRVTKRKK